jgi:rSAM/selenodomain-associated transferase 1
LNETAIVIMAKEPRPGKTKTRLCPPLTHLQAAALYEALLLDTIAMLAALEVVDLAIAITPPESKVYFQKITPGGTLLLPIEGVDIGDCLVQALGQLLDSSYRKVIALNADGPSLPMAYLHQALESLEHNDVVIGEGYDGGYYLVGLKRLHKVLFQDITWSTHMVLAQTLDQASRAGLSVSLTPAWYDIDTIQDLRRLISELPGLPADHLTHTRRALDTFEGI